MADVDLNPIRADMADHVEKSEFTSVFERIHSTCSDLNCKPLFGFVAGESNEQPQGIPYALIDYLELVDVLTS